MYEENKYCPICEKIILDNDNNEDYVFCDYCNFCKKKNFFFLLRKLFLKGYMLHAKKLRKLE